MAKSERKRTMVYSNVNKKAGVKSASQNKDIINLDDEIVIGLANFPKKENGNTKKKKINSKNPKGQAIEKTNKNVKTAQNTQEKAVAKDKIQKGKAPQKLNNKEQKELKETKVNKSIKTINVNINTNKNSNNSNSQITMQDKLRRKKIRIIRKMSILLLLIVLIVGGTIYFFLSPIFNVKAVNVINNNLISTEQIINSSGIQINENTFKFSKKEAEKKILSNPYIEEVKISRNIFTDKVQIDVKERTATLMLEYGNSYVYINNQGYILEISPVKLDSPILKGYVTPLEQVKPGNRLNKDDLERLETVLSIIEAANSNDIGDLITKIDIKNTNDYIMILESEDKTIYLGNCTDLSTQMLYVKEMIKRESGIEGEFFVNMDLNTGNPVFREKV